MRRGFVYHHNGPRARCVGADHGRCEEYWDGVGAYHAQKWGDRWRRSVYSFGVCPHGEVFVGQGWLRRQAANGRDVVGDDDGTDADWYTILFFVGGGAYGGFDTGEPEERPTQAMLDTAADLVARGQANGHAGTRVLSHNLFKPKACPGPTLSHVAAELDRLAGLDPEDTMRFTPAEATMYAHAAYREIAGREPEAGAAEAWGDLIARDARQLFRLYALLAKEARERLLAETASSRKTVAMYDPDSVRAIVAEGLAAAQAAFAAAD